MPAAPRSIRRSDVVRMLVAFAVAFVAYAGALVVIGSQAGGDEPHYLLEARSLAETGSRDLADDYADPERVAWALGGTSALEPHAFTFEPGGPLVSVHGPGLPLLLAPVAAVTDSVFVLRLWLCLLAAAAAALLFDVLRLLGVLRGAWLWAVWATSALCLPAVVFAGAVYPEIPGALCVLVVLRALLSRPPAVGWMVAAGVAVAALPWLHVRFLPVAVGLLLALVVRAGRVRTAAAVVVPTVVALAVLGAFWVQWYGSLDPRAPYEVSRFAQTVASQPALLYPNALGSLLSPDYGWLPWAPVAVIAAAALGWVCWRQGWWAVWGALLVAGYLVMVGLSNVYPSFNPPGRFVMLFLPVAAVPVAYAVAHWRAVRVAFIPLAALTALWLVLGVTRSETLTPTGTGAPQMSLAAALDAPWPKFVWDPREVSEVRPAGALDRSVGRVTSAPPLPPGEGAAAEASAGDGTGTIAAWDAVTLPEATYILGFAVQGEGAVADERTVVAELSVSQGAELLERRPILAGELPPGAFRAFLVPFRVTAPEPVTVELTTTGRAELRTGGMQIVSVRNTLGGASDVRFADWGVTLAWLALFGGVSVAMVVRDAR